MFDLYRQVVLYDEVAHAVTVSSLSLAIFFLFYKGAVPDRQAIALGTTIFTLGITVGSLQEIGKWTTGRLFDIEVVYSLPDAMPDLITNSIGVPAAALVALSIHKRGTRLA